MRDARLVIGAAVILILIIVAIYVVKFFRDQAFGSSRESDEALLDEIHKWKDSGMMYNEEYRRVQRLAAERVRDSLETGEEQATKSNADRPTGNSSNALGNPGDAIDFRELPEKIPAIENTNQQTQSE